LKFVKGPPTDFKVSEAFRNRRREARRKREVGDGKRGRKGQRQEKGDQRDDNRYKKRCEIKKRKRAAGRHSGSKDRPWVVDEKRKQEARSLFTGFSRQRGENASQIVACYKPRYWSCLGRV